MGTPIPANKARFSLEEILSATGGSLQQQGSVEATETLFSVSTDTRTLTPGSVFVALVGDTYDAHGHLDSAAEKGARLALVQRDVSAPPGLCVVRVPCTLDALGALGRAHVARWRGLGPHRHVVAITGSAGKTTTRVAVASLLGHLFPDEVHATTGNLNNRVGLPMVVFGLEDRHRVVVLEMGMNQPGEMEKLVGIARPDIALVTLVAAAHVEGVGSIEGVAFEKGTVYRASSEAGVAIGNGDDHRVMGELENAPASRRLRYGTKPGLELRIASRRPDGLAASFVELERHDGTKLSFVTPLIGEAGAYASAAAVAVAEALHHERLTSSLVEEAFSKAEVGGGAGRLVPRLLGRDVVVIDDSYNANPASSSASIRAASELAKATGRRLVLVLGAMYELGAESERGHDEVGLVAQTSGAALCFAIGKGAQRIAERALEGGIESQFFPTSADATAAVVQAVCPSDLVLVKGSRGVGTERIVRALAEVLS